MGKAKSGKKSKMEQTILSTQNKMNKQKNQKTQRTARAHARNVNRDPEQCKYASGFILKLISKEIPSVLETPFGYCKLAFNAGAVSGT